MEIRKLKKELLRQESRRRKKGRSSLFLVIPLLALLAGLCFPLFSPEARLKREFTLGMELLEEKRYEEAVGAFRSIHEGHGESELSQEALFRSAEILKLYLGRYREAILAYMLLQKDYPASHLSNRAGAQVAEIYKKILLDYPRAIVAYQKLLDKGASGGDNIQYEVADAYFRLNNFEQARIEFESLAENYPESPLLAEVGYRIGVTYSLEGALREAEEEFRRVMAEWPGSPYAVEARFALATVLEEEEELRASLDVLQDLDGVYPNEGALVRKTEQVAERIRKKQKAI